MGEAILTAVGTVCLLGVSIAAIVLLLSWTTKISRKDTSTRE